MMAVRRKQIYQSGRSEIPPPLPPTPHPGYAPNAALHAIKRHALEFVNPKELQVGEMLHFLGIFSDILERNNDYSDTLNWRRGGVDGHVFILEVPDHKSAMLIYKGHFKSKGTLLQSQEICGHYIWKFAGMFMKDL